MAVAIASHCAFASPVTHQTALIVDGPGGYRFTDLGRVGVPLNAVCAVIAIALIPVFWPFQSCLHPVYSAQLWRQHRPRPKSPGGAKYPRHRTRASRHY
jgi:hypothetical protein